ncbi:tetratricopeptide repeat protein [Pseudomaricurvus alkylphenolicus]|uniref:tetratricopeptide repeat protein n=1 Tax=Pseudomaricurvus alkylphenolicus TaxID=1306991 RepID=UPI00142056E2|nr:tetratricopeptide repeat protein [Pseudomaricurvus alkylphenolicus]NIB44583.1 tetratricopeptide repeat protein [Pseudomaricurvus alkylphenolicus]
MERLGSPNIVQWLITALLVVIQPLQAQDAEPVETGFPGIHTDYLKQLSTLSRSQPKQAIGSLENRLEQYPQWHRGRLDLARLYFLDGRYGDARQMVRQVMSEAPLPDTVRENTLRFYQQILFAQRQQPLMPSNSDSADWRFGGDLSGFFGYDSNANSGPEDADIGVDNRRLASSALEASDHYGGALLALNAYKRTDEFRWRHYLSIYQRSYTDQNDADLGNLRYLGELTLLTSSHWQVGLEWELSHYRYGSGTDINDISLTPEIQWRDKHWQISVQMEYRQRGYNFRDQQTLPESDKDADILGIGVDYQLRLNPNYRLSLQAHRVTNNAQADLYSYDATEVGAKLFYQTQPSWALWSQWYWRSSHYEAPEAPLYDDEREEDFHLLRVGWRYKVTAETSLSMTLSNYRNHANHRLHDYERSQLQLQLHRRF